MMKSEWGGAQTTGTAKRINKQTNKTNSNALRLDAGAAERSDRLNVMRVKERRDATTRAAAAAPHA